MSGTFTLYSIYDPSNTWDATKEFIGNNSFAIFILVRDSDGHEVAYIIPVVLRTPGGTESRALGIGERVEVFRPRYSGMYRFCAALLFVGSRPVSLTLVTERTSLVFYNSSWVVVNGRFVRIPSYGFAMVLSGPVGRIRGVFFTVVICPVVVPAVVRRYRYW